VLIARIDQNRLTGWMPGTSGGSASAAAVPATMPAKKPKPLNRHQCHFKHVGRDERGHQSRKRSTRDGMDAVRGIAEEDAEDNDRHGCQIAERHNRRGVASDGGSACRYRLTT